MNENPSAPKSFATLVEELKKASSLFFSSAPHVRAQVVDAGQHQPEVAGGEGLTAGPEKPDPQD